MILLLYLPLFRCLFFPVHFFHCGENSIKQQVTKSFQLVYALGLGKSTCWFSGAAGEAAVLAPHLKTLIDSQDYAAEVALPSKP